MVMAKDTLEAALLSLIRASRATVRPDNLRETARKVAEEIRAEIAQQLLGEYGR